MKTLMETITNIDTEEFMKQKEWLQNQLSQLEPSGSEATRYPEGILHMLDEIQDAAENELGMNFQIERTGTFFVPFAYERYGRIPVEAPLDANREYLESLAEEKLRKMSVEDMDKYADYLQDSEELDYDGNIVNEKGEII